MNEPRLLVVCDDPGLVGILQRNVGNRVSVEDAPHTEAVDRSTATGLLAVVFDMPAHRAAAHEALMVLHTMRSCLPATPILVLSWEPLPHALADGVTVLYKPFDLSMLRASLARLGLP